MKAILVTGGDLRVLDTPGTLADLQRFVGGGIEAGFTIVSPDSNSRAITGYVDEEGLINGKIEDGDFVGVEVGEFRNIFVGPCIIVGLNTRTGKTVGLSDTEVDAIYLSEPRILQAPHLGIMRVPVIGMFTEPTARTRPHKAKADKA